MIDFIITGLPRSATTWAANYFTTEQAVCLHDPLYTRHYRDLDSIRYEGKKVGIACTGIWRFPGWLNPHKAQKIVLRRPLVEVNDSLAAIGLPGCSLEDAEAVALLGGEHYHYSDIFNPFFARRMCEFIGLPFDADRHAELVQIEMQPNFAGLKVGAEVTRQLVAELQAALL